MSLSIIIMVWMSPAGNMVAIQTAGKNWSKLVSLCLFLEEWLSQSAWVLHHMEKKTIDLLPKGYLKAIVPGSCVQQA